MAVIRSIRGGSAGLNEEDRLTPVSYTHLTLPTKLEV